VEPRGVGLTSSLPVLWPTGLFLPPLARVRPATAPTFFLIGLENDTVSTFELINMIEKELVL